MRIAIVVLVLLTFAPRSVDAQGHETWSKNLGMYEVNVRQYTTEGTFDAFATHLDRLAEMGVGILWFMPIHPIGQQNRLGSLGSYYSVRDYLDVNPEFGTLDDFRELVDAAHERGMYVIMDWVANHTSWDNVLTVDHPEWYVTNSSGQFIPPPGTNWSDVIELDYTKQELRDWMIDALLFWLEDVGVDGFRFDAVDFVPESFWSTAIQALLAARPDALLLAEGDDARYHDLGFHMTYGWRLYGFEGGTLKEIADGAPGPAGRLLSFVEAERRDFGDDAYRLYFTSNHDENSWSGTPRELFGNAAEAFAVLTATLRGMPLVYSGQEAGLNKRLAFFDKDFIPWRDHPNEALYTTLFHLKRENHALWNGAHGGPPRRVPGTSGGDVFAFRREKDGDRFFAVFNLTPDSQSVTFTGTSHVGDYIDPFTGAVDAVEEGEIFELGPWEYVVRSSVGIDTGMEREQPRDGFELGQNYPNPFVSDTYIAYVLPEPTEITLTVHDILGRQVEVLAAGLQPAGQHRVRFSGDHLVSATYFYRLATADQVETRRMVLVR